MTEEYWAAVLKEEDRLINNSDRKFRYHCYSLESMTEELAFQERTVYIHEDIVFCSLERDFLDSVQNEHLADVYKRQEYAVLSERAETMAADFDSVSTSIKQMEHRMEQIAALKTHIINYAKTRDTYAAYRRTKAADKPAFRTAHEADLLLHEAAKRAFDAQGGKKLPTVKVLQAEYTELLTKKKAADEDYKRLRKENQELQAVKSNVDTLLRIEEEQQEKKQEQNR